MKKKKRKIKIDNKVYFLILVSFIFGVILSISVSYVLAATLVNSKDVYYEDNSGLAVNNVQAAIDGTCTKFSNELTNFLNKIYPVGSIYISTASTNPSSFLGGTWEAYGKGQTLVGIDTESTEFKTAGQTGGVKNVSYTPSGSIGSTGLTIDQIPSHTHSISHTHTTPATTISSSGAHTHSISAKVLQDQVKKVTGGNLPLITKSGTLKTNMESVSVQSGGGAHTHTVPAMTTNSISTSVSGPAGKGTTSDGHTHSFTGTATTINNLQPYITVYMWHRTK